MRILVIDDQKPWCTAIKGLVTPHGHFVDSALDTEEGFQKLISRKYDLLLLDKNVPTEEECFNLLEKIASLKNNPGTPAYIRSLQIIIFTAYGSVKSTIQTMRLDIYDYIEKETDTVDIKDNFEKALFKGIKEITIINKLHLRKETAAKLFKIPQLDTFFNKLTEPEYPEENFLFSLFCIALLQQTGSFTKTLLNTLVEHTGILNEIPDLAEIETINLKLLNQISVSLLQNGFNNHLDTFLKFITYIFSKDNPLLPTSPLLARQWYRIYKVIINLELLVDHITKHEYIIRCREIIKINFSVINGRFAEFICKNYPDWLQQKKAEKQRPAPVLSMNVIESEVTFLLNQPTYFIVFDGMRYDLWFTIKQTIQDDLSHYKIREKLYYAILPTTTTYARNSLLAGLIPEAIAEKLGYNYLNNNSHEKMLLENHPALSEKKIGYLRRAGTKENEKDLFKLIANPGYQLKVLIFNFMDDLGHLMEKIKATEYDFRMHVQTYFKNSIMQRCLKEISKSGATIVLTSDHGNIKTEQTIPLQGHTIKNQKHSRFAVVDQKKSAQQKHTITITEPAKWGLSADPGDKFILIKSDVRFAGRSSSTEPEFVHGGISMQEMLVPLVIMQKDYRPLS